MTKPKLNLPYDLTKEEVDYLSTMDAATQLVLGEMLTRAYWCGESDGAKAGMSDD